MVMFASQLPVAHCQWPVAPVATAATPCACCCCYTLCLLLPAKLCKPLGFSLSLFLCPMPNFLCICMSSLGFCLCSSLSLSLSLSRICCCLIARKRQRNKKSNFPCGLIRFGVAISRCVIAKWLQLPEPGHRTGSSSSRTWPALAKNSNFQSGTGKKKKPKRTKILI